MRIPSTQFYSTLTLLTVQSISFKKTSDVVKQLRTMYWSTFEVKAFQIHNQEYTVG